jgi:hypothetical protein
VDTLVAVQRHGKLVDTALAACFASRFSGLLYCRQQQSSYDGNNGNNGEQFDEREPASPRSSCAE